MNPPAAAFMNDIMDSDSHSGEEGAIVWAWAWAGMVRGGVAMDLPSVR